MTLKASTALRNKLLDTNPFKTIFSNAWLRIYDGPVPATADAGIDAANHVLVTITGPSSAALSWAASASAGALAKDSGTAWSGTSGTPGTASFYRLIDKDGDTGGTSTTEVRLQGTIATSGADLNMTSVVLTAPTSYTIDAFSVSLPTL